MAVHFRDTRQEVFAASVYAQGIFKRFNFLCRPHFIDNRAPDEHRLVAQHLAARHGQHVDVGERDFGGYRLCGQACCVSRQEGQEADEPPGTRGHSSKVVGVRGPVHPFFRFIEFLPL